MNRVIIFLVFCNLSLKLLSQSNSFFINLGFGSSNQPREWVDDIYWGNPDLEWVIPESRHNAYLTLGRNMKVGSKSSFSFGVGVRKEYFDSYSTYQNSASATFSNYYSLFIPTSYQRYVKLTPFASLIFGGGVNYQLYDVLYKDAYNYSKSTGSSKSVRNGTVVRDEQTFHYLKQRANYLITPQGRVLFGFQSKVSDKSNLQALFNLEMDIIKTGYMDYYFELDDRVNNIQGSYSAVSRRFRRIFFSLSLVYDFTL